MPDDLDWRVPETIRIEVGVMITRLGEILVKKASSVEDAMSFVTERIKRPGSPDTLIVPPTKKKKVDENGNILKPLAGRKNSGEFFGKRWGPYAFCGFQYDPNKGRFGTIYHNFYRKSSDGD